MQPPSSEIVDGGVPPERRVVESKLQITGPAVSLRALVCIGLVIFAAGFWHGRYLHELESGGTVTVRETPAAPQPSVATSTPATAVAATGSPATPQAAVATIPAAPGAPAPAEPLRVVVRLMKFAPENIQIHPGDEVVWENKDLTPHTVTSEAGAPHEVDSGPINANALWRHRFTTAGTFPYFCTFHPEMKGMVEVK